MFWHLRMILASKKTLGKFTKVLGFEKTPPLWEKFPKNPVFFFDSVPYFNLLQGNDIAAFQKLFMAKRIEQLAAVKNIQKLDESKRKLLLDQISAKLFQVR